MKRHSDSSLKITNFFFTSYEPSAPLPPSDVRKKSDDRSMNEVGGRVDSEARKDTRAGIA